jgi:TrmH family RNA methyltransferase
MALLSSRDNPRVRRWARLARDARYRRSERRALVEGPHLLAAALQAGWRPIALIATEQALRDGEIARLAGRSGVRPVTVTTAAFRAIADTETPQGIAAEVAIPDRPGRSAARVVFLEGVQDPSNVGAIVRSAAAFAVGRIVLDPGCADPWSPKALRAGMGGHFALAIELKADLGAELNAFRGDLLCTVPRDGMPIEEADLTGPVGWIFGGEGRGLSEETLRQVPLRVTIPMAEGSESLNVAAAAAICLYETFRKGS